MKETQRNLTESNLVLWREKSTCEAELDHKKFQPLVLLVLTRKGRFSELELWGRRNEKLVCLQKFSIYGLWTSHANILCKCVEIKVLRLHPELWSQKL
jgi:hypothetical protein